MLRGDGAVDWEICLSHRSTRMEHRQILWRHLDSYPKNPIKNAILLGPARIVEINPKRMPAIAKPIPEEVSGCLLIRHRAAQPTTIAGTLNNIVK